MGIVAIKLLNSINPNESWYIHMQDGRENQSRKESYKPFPFMDLITIRPILQTYALYQNMN